MLESRQATYSTLRSMILAVVNLLKADDLLKLPSDLRCELIDGVLIELSPPGELHARIAGRMAFLLSRAEAMGLGYVLGEAGYVLREDPDTVRAPDVAFVRRELVGPEGFARGFARRSPDIIVEVVSPYDTRAEIQAKVREWIEGGAALVLVVEPDAQVVEAVRSLTHRSRCEVGDILDLDDLLPGFSLSVAEIFEAPS